VKGHDEPRGAGHDPDTQLVSLTRRARRGLGLSLANNVLVRAGTFLTGVVLARILAPHDYGVYAVALVVLNALFSMNELGVSVALVRWPGDPRRIIPTVATLSIGSSLLMYVVSFIAAPWLTSAMGVPEATGVLRLMGVAVVIDGITSVPVAMLAREFGQGRRLIIDITSLAVVSCTTLVLAATHHGVWSLAIGQVAGNLTTLVLAFLLVTTRFRPGWDGESARELVRFGLPLAGSSFLVFAVLNIDYVVVASMRGAVELGYYLLAFNLSSWPVNAISTAVRRVSLPYFAQLRETPAQVSTAFARALGLLLLVTVPVCALLSAFAIPMVRVVYGARWTPSAAALAYLAILGGARVVFELCYDFLVADARPRATLRLQVVWLISLAAALPAAAHWGGVRGVAMAHAAVAVIVMAPLFFRAIMGSGVRLRDLRRPATGPLLGTLGVAAAAAASLSLGDGIARLAIGGGGALLVYLVVQRPQRWLATWRAEKSYAGVRPVSPPDPTTDSTQQRGHPEDPR